MNGLPEQKHQKNVLSVKLGRMSRKMTIKKGKHLSPRTEFKKGQVPWIKGKNHSEVSKKKMSKAKEGYVTWIVGKKHRDESIRKMSKSHKGCKAWNKGLKSPEMSERNKDKEFIKKRTEGIRRKVKTKEWKENNKRLLSKVHNDIEIQKRRFKAISAKPNKSEKKLIELINQNNLPYKYTGNGDFIIGKKCPDFVNVNGQKKIIELFGEWWHLKKPDIPYNRTEFGTKAIYSQYGFKTLVIWESELKDMDKVLERIKNFEVN